ncbi:MAG TPA: PfkB family carbohydrate kinase [Actinomycetaceae bacterium]|nr:PfkB family carbohydrate kinase [Actinomycetaceae bacterium]
MSQLTGTELRRPRVCVLAPTPLLTIEIDPFDPRHPRNDSSTGRPPGDVHLHPGGQGLWVARMAASLGAEVTVCGPFGGEVGPLLITSLTSSNLTVRPVTYLGGNGAYVYDCSSGERRVAAHMVPAQLTRHELDDLYGTVLVEALDADVVSITGADPSHVVPSGFLARLVRDIRASDIPVVTDLSGEAAALVAAQGPSVLKMSHEELISAGLAGDDSLDTLVHAATALLEAGVGAMVVSRASEPALLVTAEGANLVEGPVITPQDHRGAGDSMTAGIAVGLGRGEPINQAVRLGAAAGALNVTRRGLGTGRREHIERFASLIDVKPLAPDEAGAASAPVQQGKV